MISLKGFAPISEGVHVFKITGVEYKEAFGKLILQMVTKEGKKHTETYRLLDGKSQPNPSAMAAFSYFAKTVMNNFDLEEIDEQELVGHYFKATVTHNIVESTKTPGKMLTFVQLSNQEPADCFEGEQPAEEIMKVEEDESDNDLLASILGN